MKRPITNNPRRPARPSSLVVKDRKDAAIHIVRLEFDCARLTSGIAQAQKRIDGFELELRRNDAERRSLLSILNQRR